MRSILKFIKTNKIIEIYYDNILANYYYDMYIDLR